MRRWLLPLLLVGLAGASQAARPPADLDGEPGRPELAWRMPGVAPGSTVAGYPVGDEYELLLAGDRQRGETPQVGDVALLNPRGWGRRRLTTTGGLAGLPALLDRVVIATGRQGAVHLWPTHVDPESEPLPTLVLGEPATLGPVVVGAQFVVAAGRKVTCVTNLTEVRWERELPLPVSVPMASDGARLLVAADDAVHALSLETGRLLWSQTVPAEVQTGLQIAAGMVLAGWDDGTLRAFDLVTGEPQWGRQVTDSPFAAHLALAGPWVFATTEAGRLLALDLGTGEDRWHAARVGPLSSPVLAFGAVLVVDGERRLNAVAVANDGLSWVWPEAASTDSLSGPPSVFGRRVYVSTAAGELLAVNLLDARGAAPWPVLGGGLQRNGRVLVDSE